MSLLLALLLLVHDEPEFELERSCVPLVEVLDKVHTDIYQLPPEAVAGLLAIHNALPPAGADEYTYGAYGTMQSGAGIVLWIRGAQVCSNDNIPPGPWSKLLPLIKGVET